MENREFSQQFEGTEKNGKGLIGFVGGMFTGILVVGVICAIYMHRQSLSIVGESNIQTSVPAQEASVIDKDVLQKLGTLEDAIDRYYLGSFDKEDLEDSLYHGFVAGLGDPYSVYYSEEELEAVLEATEGIYYGIGAYIGVDQETGYCKVTKVMEGTPAEEAGVMADDLIVAVNGESMLNVSSSEIVTYIKGPEHTTVDLLLYREGAPDYVEVTVERRQIETPTVTYSMDEDRIATLQISEFDEVTLGQFEQFLDQAKKEGMKGLVLDLRDNPGGSLQTVVGIAGYFLPKGLVVYTEDKNGNRREFDCDGKDELDVPLVVLINGNSASASEILAGAIKDYKKGTLLGTTTFGKGIVQKIYPITDGSGVKLTISHYYTPSGADIHGVGIAPDEELKLDVDAYLENGYDNQMERAKEILRSQITGD